MFIVLWTVGTTEAHYPHPAPTAPRLDPEPAKNCAVGRRAARGATAGLAHLV